LLLRGTRDLGPQVDHDLIVGSAFSRQCFLWRWCAGPCHEPAGPGPAPVMRYFKSWTNLSIRRFVMPRTTSQPPALSSA